MRLPNWRDDVFPNLTCRCATLTSVFVITMPMKQPIFLEDFELGATYESPSHLVTEEEAIDFARRYDPQYFHLDAEAAKDSAFGGLVCGGFQTAALTWALALKSGMFDDCPLAGIGLDELRWLAPVKPGHVLRCRFKILEWRTSESRPEAGIARIHFEVINQDDVSVITMVMIQLMRRRPIASS